MSGTRKRRIWPWLAGIVAFIVVVAVVVTAAVVWSDRSGTTVAAAPGPDPAPAALLPATDAGPLPDVPAALAGPAGDPALGALSGEVSDAATGKSLWSGAGDRPLVPASSTKLLTASAALLELGPDATVPTVVARGARPGEVVVVGGGDVTLARTAGSGTFTDAATVADLADQVRAALGGEPVTAVTVDDSVRGGSFFNDTWDRADVAGGNVTDLGGTMLDAGRVDPRDTYSPRSTTPSADVGHALAAALGAPDVPVATSPTPVPHADTLGEVRSAPLVTRVRDMLLHSDNLLAEAVGREVAAHRGAPGTFRGAVDAVLGTLRDHGLGTDGAVLVDTSGMSGDDRLSAHLLDGVLAAAAAPRAGDLGLLFDALPVAGGDGTLRDRYSVPSGARDGAGWVRAKTGTLDGVNALAGTVTTRGGRALTFAFISNTPGGGDIDAGRAALDRLAAALRDM